MTAPFVITGRDLALTIGTKDYAAQGSTVTLTRELNQFVGETIQERFYKTIDATATLSVEMFADWGNTGSICDALYDASVSSPDTALAFTFDVGGSTFTGFVFPVAPAAGGGAVDVLTTTVELVVKDGAVARA